MAPICDVMQADDGQQAVDAAQARRFGLMCMDIIVPRMDGITAMMENRTRGPNIALPVIARIAHARTQGQDRFHTAGIVDKATVVPDPELAS